MAQPSPDIQQRLMRYLSVQVPDADIPYGVRARAAFASFGLSDSGQSSVARVAADLRLSEAESADLVSAFSSVINQKSADDKARSLTEIRQICEKHVANGKVIDVMDLAYDLEALDLDRDRRLGSVYREIISQLDLQTAQAIEDRITDNASVKINLTRIDYVGLAGEFPEVLTQKFEALCSSDLEGGSFDAGPSRRSGPFNSVFGN